MTMTNELARFKRVSDFRVDAVEQAYFRRPEPLYPKRDAPTTVVQYVGFSNKSHATVDEALAAVKRELDGS